MEKYHQYITLINNGIEGFSKYLQPEFQIQSISTNKLNDSNTSWNLKAVGWHETRFPNGDSPGVYIIFGQKKNDESFLGIYVGKASHNSVIGYRLYSHLHNPERENRIYPMKDKLANDFLLEFVITIPMNEIYFLAPALEEFLIDYLQSQDVYLINAVGNNFKHTKL
jgi:hypothetical protein